MSENLSTASDFRRAKLKKSMSQREFARMGGNALFAKIGSAGMAEMGKTNAKRFGPTYFSSIRKGIKFKQ